MFLISIWIGACFLLIKSYAGNLTAIIAKPKLDMKFNMPEDFLNQDEIQMVIEKGIGAIEYMRQSPTNSTMRRLIEKTKIYAEDDLDPEEIIEDCFTNTDRFIKNYAAICDIDTIKSRLSADFSKTGQCNFYTTQNSPFQNPVGNVMAFQVSNERI